MAELFGFYVTFGALSHSFLFCVSLSGSSFHSIRYSFTIRSRRVIGTLFAHSLWPGTWSSSPFLINKTLFIWNNYPNARATVKFFRSLSEWHRCADPMPWRHFIAVITIFNVVRRKRYNVHKLHKNESMHKIIKNERFVCNWSVRIYICCARYDPIHWHCTFSLARARAALSVHRFVFLFVALQAETNIRLMCVQHVLRDGR